jgi:hypothetical protein
MGQCMIHSTHITCLQQPGELTQWGWARVSLSAHASHQGAEMLVLVPLQGWCLGRSDAFRMVDSTWIWRTSVPGSLQWACRQRQARRVSVGNAASASQPLVCVSRGPDLAATDDLAIFFFFFLLQCCIATPCKRSPGSCRPTTKAMPRSTTCAQSTSTAHGSCLWQCSTTRMMTIRRRP